MLRLENISKQLNPQQIVYSVPVGPVRKGQSRIYRHPDSRDGLPIIPNSINNLANFWDSICSKFANNIVAADLKYIELDLLAKRTGSWLKNDNHQIVYIYAKNCLEWTITDLACWNYGVVNIPLYDTLEAFHHIINLTQGTLIFYGVEVIDQLIKNIKINKANIKKAVSINSVPHDKKLELQALGVQTIDFKELTEFGSILSRPAVPIDHHLTYCFTSGTTGLPKGVITTHKMVIAQCLAIDSRLQFNFKDVHLSFLPIAHTFERFVIWIVLLFGARIAYSVSPVTEIVKQLMKNKPTIIPMVPRLLNKLYPVAVQILKQTGDKQKVKDLFGGKLRFMITGSAPISAEILTFFSKNLDCDIREGYGQTETTAAAFATDKADTNFGHIGGPNRCTQYKLVDVPEMHCFTSSDPPKGQICMRGDSVFRAYFKDQKNTRQTVDEEGWNHSGDIGIILPNGAVKIVDRKKNIYKLSQGEYIAPEKIENIYGRCPYVAETFIYGDSYKDYNVAVIHPNLQALAQIAKKLKLNQTDPSALCRNTQIIQFWKQQVTQQGKQDGLFGFQQAKKITLWPTSFSTHGIFTSTMKLQRHAAKQFFKKQIQNMYQSK